MQEYHQNAARGVAAARLSFRSYVALLAFKGFRARHIAIIAQSNIVAEAQTFSGHTQIAKLLGSSSCPCSEKRQGGFGLP